MCVFKINTLAFGKHRYQIDNNGKQLALTGITLFHPKMNLVIVEGGVHAVEKYKKLMLNRIKWTDNGRPTDIQEEKSASDPLYLKAKLSSMHSASGARRCARQMARPRRPSHVTSSIACGHLPGTPSRHGIKIGNVGAGGST
jgi:hypothetical protein